MRIKEGTKSKETIRSKVSSCENSQEYLQSLLQNMSVLKFREPQINLKTTKYNRAYIDLQEREVKQLKWVEESLNIEMSISRDNHSI